MQPPYAPDPSKGVLHVDWPLFGELSRALQSLLMRRGLFIASDEVAAYTQSIFSDRIQKREAHLRWAAEVTQTINVEQLLSKPKIGSEFTNADVAAKSQPPRAQGQVQGPMAEPAPMSMPPAFKETNNSLPTGVLTPQQAHSVSFGSGGHHFFALISLSMRMSSAWSATRRLSFRFSFSSSRRRAASETSIPPYFERHR